MGENQRHLSRKAQINMGSFYTPKKIVEEFYLDISRIENFKNYTILDTSCGYGSFLDINLPNRKIGVDIDRVAVEEAKNSCSAEVFHRNSLKNVSRESIGVAKNEKIIIVGNPPYNDTTSIIRSSIKDAVIEMDKELKSRDLGISFLLSYNKLKADYVCVLHPLSYLIKKANFSLMKDFSRNYELISGKIISSHEFSDNSRGMAFPIVAAIYKRTDGGMSYDFIKKYRFQIKNNVDFSISDFDIISNYITKYPNKKSIKPEDKIIAKFYTMRDINALRRNRTFIDTESYNTIFVKREDFPYYCYVDVFKRYLDKIPYYLGNNDIPIDHNKFIKLKKDFVAESINNNPVLSISYKHLRTKESKARIEKYFKELIGVHYVTD